MSPKRSNIQDGLNRFSSGNRPSLEPLQPHQDDHPLDDRYLHASLVDGEHLHMNESESEGMPGAFLTGTRTSRARQKQQAIAVDCNCQEKTAPMTDDAAALVSVNQDLRQQTMELKLQLADAMAKIDELVQQNRQLMHMHNMQAGHTSTEQAMPGQTYREYNQDMKPAADTNNHSDQKPRNTALQNFDRSLGYGQGDSRPSAYRSKSGGPLQALGGVASVRNMFSSLRGEAEVTDASSALAISEGKRSSIFSNRSSFYSARSMSSVSTSIRNDDSSQSISLHPDDLARCGGDNSIPSIGNHNSGSALESTPEESAVGTKQCEKVTHDSTTTAASWLQKLSSLPGLNRGESAGSAHLEDDGGDAQAKHLHRLSRRGSNSAPNLSNVRAASSHVNNGAEGAEQERQKLRESISHSTLAQFHGSTLDLMALAPSKLAEVTGRDKVAGSVLVHSVERAADQTHGIRRKFQDSHGNDRRSNPNKPLNAGDQFQIPLKAEKTKAKASTTTEEDGGMKRNNTDKDVNDFFRRMSGAMSDDDSDAEDLAACGNNEDWDDFADKKKNLSPSSNDGVKNNFAAMADKLIADSTFDLYK